MSIEFMSISFMPVDWAAAMFAVAPAIAVKRHIVMSVFIRISNVRWR
jgi:hypothetical protein